VSPKTSSKTFFAPSDDLNANASEDYKAMFLLPGLESVTTQAAYIMLKDSQ
jgi:hypothetical protein